MTATLHATRLNSGAYHRKEKEKTCEKVQTNEGLTIVGKVPNQILVRG